MNKSEKSSVLFVDDEDVNLFLFEKRFESDFKVLTASSGPEGLKKLEHHAKDLSVVISDMRMPEMSGLEFIKEAKKQYHHIKFFILTGYSFNVELEEALEKNEIDKIFKKPFDYEIIKGAIELVRNEC